MFSGGEPTIHPRILDFIKLANDKGVNMVTLDTNGLRLAHDRRFMAELAELNVPNSAELQPVLLTTKYGSKTAGTGGVSHMGPDSTNVGKSVR